MSPSFPDPTPQERNHMRRLAFRIARQFRASLGDWEDFAKDLEMAGWCCFYGPTVYGKPDGYVWKSVARAMVNAWSEWRFGTKSQNKREHTKRTHVYEISYDLYLPHQDKPSSHITEEEHMMLKDMAVELFSMLSQTRYTGVRKTLAALCLSEGSVVSPAERKRFGIVSPKRLYEQRNILKRCVGTCLKKHAPTRFESL